MCVCVVVVRYFPFFRGYINSAKLLLEICFRNVSNEIYLFRVLLVLQQFFFRPTSRRSKKLLTISYIPRQRILTTHTHDRRVFRYTLTKKKKEKTPPTLLIRIFRQRRKMRYGWCTRGKRINK